MIALRVLRRPEGPVAAEPLCVAPAGATIGRAPDCDLVLADPLRVVSRQHARLVPHADDAGTIHCVSASAPLWVNDETVPPGGECVVRCGDKVRIGGFELQVESAAAASAAAQVRRALADFAPRRAPAAARAGAAPPPAPPLALPAHEPPAVAPAPKMVAPSPAAHLESALPSAAPPLVADVAAEPAPTPPASRTPAQPAARGAEPRRSRLDSWFDLDAVVDPLAPGSPLPMLAAQPVAHGSGNASARLRPATALPPAPRVEAARGEPAPAEAAPESTPAPKALNASGVSELVEAFMRGAGLATPSMMPQAALTPEWMQHLGSVLRAATEGTLALLQSRATTKREIRAEGTRILPRENNPLKFAPDAAEALARLLDPRQARGFLSPVEALRDAHNDLLLHQVAMAAGMRAAVFELISRLGPTALESEHGPARGAALLIPTLRDAELWQRHRERHAHLLEHLDDDFEAIFGREFLRAYEAQSRLLEPARDAAAPRGE